MKTRIVRIGNSQGIRIPKPLLEASGLGEEVDLEVHDHRIVISAATRPRETWEAAFMSMTEEGDDFLLDSETSGTTWDEEEWEW
ncbi:MAG: AbrB/MazE/SpoVT family DNA-binding domain-containing protein [Gemmatimonadota bacterium]